MLGLSIIILFFFIKNNKIKHIITFFTVIMLFIGIENKFGIIHNKISMENDSFTGRTSEFGIFAKNYFEHPILGVGYQNNSIFKNNDIINGTNGILSLILQFGLLGFVYLGMIYKAILRLNTNSDYRKKYIIRDICLYILFCSLEPVMFQPLFILLLFIDGKEEKIKKYKECELYEKK